MIWEGLMLINVGETLRDIVRSVLRPSYFRPNVTCSVFVAFMWLLNQQAVFAEMVPRSFSGHSGPVRSLAFSPDGRTIVSGSWDTTVRVWDVDTGACLRTLSGHSLAVSSIAFSPDGRTLASGSGDKTVRLWDPDTGVCVKTLSRQGGMVYSVAFSPDGRTVASATDDGMVRLWDVSSGSCLRTFGGHSAVVWSVAFSPDGRTLVSGSWDKTVRLWDTETGACLRTLTGHDNLVNSVAFSPDGRTLASGSGDKTVRLWDAATGAYLRTLSGHSVWLASVAFSPDGRTLASGSGDKTVRLWDARTGACLKTLTGHSAVVWSMAFSPDGRSLASGSEDKTIQDWPLWQDEILCKYLPSRSTSPASMVAAPLPLEASETDAQRQARIAARAQEMAHKALKKRQAEEAEASTLAQQLIAAQAQTPVPPPASNALPVIIPAIGSQPVSISQNKNALSRPVADKWALVVGISQFKNPKYNLKYAAKDARDFYNYLINEANFQKDHVVLLIDENATRENIMRAFGSKFLPAVSEADDLVAVFVSTHGTPARVDQGGRNYLVAYNTDADDPYVTGVDMDEINRRLKEGVKSDRAIIIMDTCYSGGAIPGAKGVDAIGNFDANELAAGSGHLVISSSSPSERSWESTVTPNGVFTKYLLQSLRSKDRKVDVKTAFNDTKEKVAWEVKSAFGKSQTPQLGGEWQGKELILSVPATKPRTIFNQELLQMMRTWSTSSTLAPASSQGAPTSSEK